MTRKKQPPEVSIVRSSAAEYLTFVAASGSQQQAVEMRYEDENIWLSQKMMATLYDVTVPAISQHLKRIKWATQVVKDYTIQGWVMDVERRRRGDRRARRRRAAPHGADDSGGRAAGEDPPLRRGDRQELPLGDRDGRDREILQDAGKVSAELAEQHALSELEKYRIVQAQLFESDFDRVLTETKRLSEGTTKDAPRKGKKS